jgi:hypothetical protein
MRFYTVHVRPVRAGADPDAVLVQEGFSWPAFLFSPVWFLWHRLWVGAAGWLAGLLLLSLLLDLAGIGEAGQSVIGLIYALATGLHAGDVRRWTLSRAGYRLDDVVSGHNAAEAERRWLDRAAPLRATVLGFAA